MSERADFADSITLAVIAGGAGLRMGVPKAWLTIGGKPILGYLLDRWSWGGRKLLVTSPARRHPPAWERFDCEVVDSVPDQGPLRGLLTALEAARTEIIVAVTCDMPRIERGQILWLGERLVEQPGAQGVLLAHEGSEAIEPFPCALRKSAAGLLRERLDGRDRSVHSLERLPDFSVAMIPEEWPARTWTNLNLPADLELFLKEVGDVRPDGPKPAVDRGH